MAALPKPVGLKLALFAAVLMTFVFDQAARRQAKQSDVTHPAAQHRLVDLIRTVASNLMQEPGEIRQAFAATLVEMDRLHACLPSFQASSTLLNDLRSVSLQRELDEIDDALTAARPQFAPFAYGAAKS